MYRTFPAIPKRWKTRICEMDLRAVTPRRRRAFAVRALSFVRVEIF
jgi:hypothetical protein